MLSDVVRLAPLPAARVARGDLPRRAQGRQEGRLPVHQQRSRSAAVEQPGPACPSAADCQIIELGAGAGHEARADLEHGADRDLHLRRSLDRRRELLLRGCRHSGARRDVERRADAAAAVGLDRARRRSTSTTRSARCVYQSAPSADRRDRRHRHRAASTGSTRQRPAARDPSGARSAAARRRRDRRLPERARASPAEAASTRLQQPMALLRMITAGESHGPGLTCVLEGLPGRAASSTATRSTATWRAASSGTAAAGG